MLQVGERIGDYEVLQILGAGGMGQVYKVRNSITDRIEAMKVLLPELAGDTDLADRFLREIKVQASLVHRNIAQLYTARREGDQIVMLMEFVDGLTLDQLLRRGPLNINTVVSIFSQILDALGFAHAHGVVHRDIKPQNIMVQPDGTAKLMDFGIARMGQDQRLTQTGRTLGSLFYMSPEQIRGNEDIDGRSDLYSLGVTLYEAATGARPFEGTSDYSIMAAHLQEPAIPPVDRDKRLPQVLSDVIMAAIEKDRENRFQSAAAFKAALSHVSPDAVSAAQPAAQGATLIAPEPVPPIPAPPSLPKIPTRPAFQSVKAAPVAPPPSIPMPSPPMPPPPAPIQVERSKAGMMMGIGALAFAALAGVGVWQYPRMFPPAAAPTAAAQPAPAVAAVQQAAPAPATDPIPESKPPESKPPEIKAPEIKAKDPEPQQPTSPAKTKPAIVAAREQTRPPEKRTVEPQPPPVVAVVQPPQATPPVVANNPPPAEQQPQVSPAVMREMQELRARYNHLSIELAGCTEAMASLEAQQRQMGLGLRGDLKDAARLAHSRMQEVQAALRARDVETARTNLDLAERSVEHLSKVLGR